MTETMKTAVERAASKAGISITGQQVDELAAHLASLSTADLAELKAAASAVAMADAENPGCPRCRMDLIEFVREVKLPRFTMQAGEQWSLPQSRYNAAGDAELGAGICPRDSFKVLAFDADRACGCTCQKGGK